MAGKLRTRSVFVPKVALLFVVVQASVFVMMSAVTSTALAAEQGGRPTCCIETEVSYHNGNVVLAAVLLMPWEEGEYPGAVILQGSGSSDRSNAWARLVAETLVSKGVAVLLTDKRGAGKSTGDWRTSSFDDLARDGLAGLEALRAIDGIREDRLGFVGLSQGGHVAPLAASMGDAQFLVNLVGSALPMKDTLFHELEQTYRQLGLDDDSVEFLQEMTRLSFVYIETGRGFDEYLSHRESVQERFGQAAIDSWPSAEADDYWEFWRLIHDFDPIPYWREAVDQRGIPAFIAYGELDEFDNVPVRASVKRLERELDGKQLTVNVYADTGHSLMDEAEMAEGRFKLVDELLTDLDTWLEQNLSP
jgi:pimeloyl-ACP methyl ester carboxylesterase